MTWKNSTYNKEVDTYPHLYTLFLRASRHEAAGTTVTPKELAQGLPHSPSQIRRRLKRLNVNCLARKVRAPPPSHSPPYERMQSTWFTPEDMVYLFQIPRRSLHRELTKRHIRMRRKPLFKDDGHKIHYAHAMQAYEAQDVGFGVGEISELCDLKESSVHRLLHDRILNEPIISLSLRRLFHDPEIHTPYVTPSYVRTRLSE